jgi:hypothetical protein
MRVFISGGRAAVLGDINLFICCSGVVWDKWVETSEVLLGQEL